MRIATTIMTLLLTALCYSSFGQLTISQQLDQAKIQQEKAIKELTDSRNDLRSRSSSEINSTITELRLELLDQRQSNVEGSNDAKIQELTQSIQTKETEIEVVRSLEKRISELNATLKEIRDNITVLEGLAEIQADKDKAAELKEQSDQSLAKSIEDARLALAQNVNGWLSLSGGLNGMHGTAKNLIVFDENTNEKIGKKLLTGGLDVMTIGFGALSVDAYSNGGSGGEKIGFPLLAVLGKISSEFLSKNKKARQALEGLTRNVVLGDVIYKNQKVTEVLDQDIRALHAIMFPDSPGVSMANTNQGNLRWDPTLEDIQSFKKIVDDINVLYLFLIDVRQAALILLEDKEMTQESREKLEELTKTIADAQQNWFKSRNIFEPYVIILEESLRQKV